MTCNGCFWRGLVNCLPMSLNFIYLFVITLALPIAFFFADYEWNSRRGHDIIFYLFPLNGQIKLSKPALINYAYLSDFSLSMWEKSDSANVVWHFQFIWIASLAFVISINWDIIRFVAICGSSFAFSIKQQTWINVRISRPAPLL